MPENERIDGVKPVRKKLASGEIKTYYYHRATNTKLPGEPGSAVFAAALAAANARAQLDSRDVAPTIGTLIRLYQGSPDWKLLAPYTRQIAQFHISAVEAEYFDMPLSVVERKGARAIFLEWRDDMAESTPAAADAKLTWLARILKFGFDREHIDRHPLSTFKRVYAVDRSDIIWLPEHFDRLRASTASPAMKLAAFMALHTGQRRGDLIALRWHQYDGKGITLIQSKSKRHGKAGKLVYVPATKALKITLDLMRAAVASAHAGASIDDLHVLNSARGAPWTNNGFRLAWEHAFAASGIEGAGISEHDADLHFHDIRGTAVTMLAEAGCTVPEIATLTGHSLLTVTRILERYLSRTKSLAEAAIAKLEIRMAV